jgi:hypothetical protein
VTSIPAVLAAAVTLVAGLGFPQAGGQSPTRSATPAATPGTVLVEEFVDATYNVLYTNPARVVAHDLARVLDRVQLVRLQEVSRPGSRAGLARTLATHPAWATWWPRRTALPILYDTRVLASAGPGGQLLTWPRIAGLPRRWTTWKPLRLRATGQLLLIVNTHAMARGCRSPVEPLRAISARTHWATVAWLTGRWIRSHGYDAILPGGDFNCLLAQREHWWQPGRILAPFYRFDRIRSVDRLLLRANTGHVTVLARWSVRAGLHSDHALHLRRLLIGQ